jgi:hypothetical protein
LCACRLVLFVVVYVIVALLLGCGRCSCLCGAGLVDSGGTPLLPPARCFVLFACPSLFVILVASCVGLLLLLFFVVIITIKTGRIFLVCGVLIGILLVDLVEQVVVRNLEFMGGIGVWGALR